MIRLATIRTKVLGARIVNAKIAKVTDNTINWIKRGVYVAGVEIMVDAKKRTPIDTETLKRSGYVTLPEKNGNLIVSELGYGGPAQDYTLPQHETLEYHHKIGEAKFLEKALDNKRTNTATTIANFAQASFTDRSVQSPGKNTNMPASPWEGPFPNLLPKHRRPAGANSDWQGTSFGGGDD